MQSVTHHGRDTAYRATDFEDGDPVLYVHGAGSDHRVWVEQYGPKGIGPAVAVDLTGHGESEDVDLVPGVETMNAYADDVVAVAEATGARTLVGNSMGGGVALWTALERDLTLDALVLTGAGAKFVVNDGILELLDTDFDASVEAIHAPNLFFHDADEGTLERSKTVVHETGASATARDFQTCASFDVRDRLDEIEVPALALTGEHDGMMPPSFSEYLGEHLPNCAVDVLDDCAHFSMLERPEAWNERVRAFLDRSR